MNTDLDQLREQHPLWAIGSVWASAASGPDCRWLAASREGVQLHAWNAAELSRKIAAEEITNGWPCKIRRPADPWALRHPAQVSRRNARSADTSTRTIRVPSGLVAVVLVVVMVVPGG